MYANISVHEPKPPDDPDSPLSFSMEGNPDQPPSALIPFFWTPGWNSIQAVNKFQDEIAGSLHGGDPGLRLLDPALNATGSYAQAVPRPFVARSGEWLIVPLHHIFGSEELAHHAPAVAELAPKPYLALGAEDADRLQFKADEQVSVSLDGSAHRLPILILPGLPRGIAGMPVGLAEAEWVRLPAWARVERRP
jgi:NADH-quinone oxidoreductase subunit G